MTSRALLLLLIVPVLATGCGSSSPKQAATPTRLTQAQFVAAANAVCIKSDKRVFQLGRLSLLPRPWGLTAVAAHEGVLEMSFLQPPAKSEAGFRHLLVLGRRLETGIEQVRDALAKKDYAAARDAQVRATRADTAIHLQAKKLGLTFCQQLLTNWPA
jgi:hypothetical protein